MSDALRVARSVLRLVGRRTQRRLALLPALALTVSALEVIGAGAIYLLLGLLTSPDGVTTAAPVVLVERLIPGRDVRLSISGLVLFFFALRGVAVVGRAYVEQRLVASASVEIAERLLAGYLMMPYRFHVSRNSAELVRNAYVNTDRVQREVLRPLVMLVADTVLVIALAIVIVVTDPVGALVAGGLLGGVALSLQRFLRPRLREWGRRAQVAATGGVQAIQQAIGGLREIRVLRREQAFLHEHSRQRRIQARTYYLSQAVNALPRALIEFALIGTVVGLTVITLLRGEAVEDALATLGLFAYAGIRIQQPLQLIVINVNTLRYSAAVVDEVADDLDGITKWQQRLDQQPDTELEESPFDDALEISDVRLNFSTDPAVRPALDGVSLTVARGQFVGICGPTGGGKSTLLDVLIGLLPPDSGNVTVDGRALDLAPAWWWGQLGVVSQNVYLTDDTLRRNIAFGTDEAEIDEDRLVRAVERAQLADFVATLPDGLDTLVGERGVRLSGGQRQRVAVARALYREPPVIILDEGTSALDTATESALIRALDTIAPDRTLIAVAHRISTLRGADRIVVLEEGRVTAEGTYDELLATSATFRVLAGAT